MIWAKIDGDLAICLFESIRQSKFSEAGGNIDETDIDRK